MSVTDALAQATPPLRSFMLRQTRDRDLALFVELGRVETPQTPGRTADAGRDSRPTPSRNSRPGFQMGFFLFIPFLLIDLVVSTTLLSMGMLQLPPAMISLPFKVMLFVLIDGWNLVVGSVVRSFAM